MKRYIIIILVMLITSAQIISQTGLEISMDLLNNVVRIHSTFDDGTDENGFGFIVAERDDKLYIATANHVVEKGPLERLINVSFFENPGKTFEASYQNGISDANLDLALLVVQKPEWLNWTQRCLAEEIKNGDAVWFIGRDREWYYPSLAEAGSVQGVDPFYDFIIKAALPTVQKGSSGSPVINHLGVFGIIISDQQTTKILSIKKIKQIVESAWSLPFHLSKYEKVTTSNSRTVYWAYPNEDESSFSMDTEVYLNVFASGFWELVDRVEFFVNGIRITIDSNPKEKVQGDDLLHSAESYWRPSEPGTYNLQAIAYNTNGTMYTTEMLKVVVLRSIDVGGVLAAIVPSENDTEVFLLRSDQSKLMILNPVTEEITKEVILPYQAPISMQYHAPNKTLYILHKYSGKVIVFDTSNWSFDTIEFSKDEDGRVIVIIEAENRILVLGNKGSLFCIDMTTKTKLWTHPDFNGDDFLYNPYNQSIHSVVYSNDSDKVYSYKLDNDKLELKSVRDNAGVNCNSLYLNPLGQFVLLPCGGGNGIEGYKVFQMDSNNINDVTGAFDFGTYPQSVWFSGNNLLYGNNGDFYDNYIYVMDAQTRQIKEKINFPNSDCDAIMVTTASEKYLLAFSYDNHPASESPDYRIFIYDIQNED